MRYCIIDLSNMAHRAKHAVGHTKLSNRNIYDPFGDTDTIGIVDANVGLILTIVFNGILNAFEKFDADHVVATFDKQSWRRGVFPEYKANRRNKVLTPSELEDREVINKTIDEVEDFLRDYTNVTVLARDGAEADDFIARWCQIHDEENHEHIIVSSDGDFKQLVHDQTVMYNPRSRELYANNRVYHQDRKIARKKPSKILFDQLWYEKYNKDGSLVEFDYEWELFEKCIRGDRSDNIPSAWPRVHTKKMKEAFFGSTKDFNNFINSYWGPDTNRHSVKEIYERNMVLIDLSMQPENVLTNIDETIIAAIEQEPAKMVGSYFAKFCSKYDLVKLGSQADRFVRMLVKKYE